MSLMIFQDNLIIVKMLKISFIIVDMFFIL